MQREHERPLDNRELRIVRGMIDEYVYNERRRKFWRSVFTDGRIAVATLTAVALVMLQIVAIVLSIRYHGR